MKQNIKVFVVALLLGMVASYFVCYKGESIILFAQESSLTIFEVGTYTDYNQAVNKQSEYSNSIIITTDNLYRVIIGGYTNSDTIDLMRSYFNDLGYTFQEKDIAITNDLIDEITSIETLINSSTTDYYEIFNNSILTIINEYF